ncbi:basigin-like [Conger conger]|uniref:basigin-like n=1 Tax=Conger conger TaxID=82655 RepID=UPI002A5A8054|nr:basigin-like [Conger conger]
MAVLWSCSALLLVCLYTTGANAGVIVAEPSVFVNQSSAVLTCNYTGPGAIEGHFWRKNGKDIEASKQDSSEPVIEYKLNKIDSHSGGVYSCVYTVDGAEAKEDIEVRTVPHVGAYKHSEHGNEGDKGVLVCMSHGYPLPTDWEWLKLGEDGGEQPITNGTDRYEIMTTPEKTTLSIDKLDMDKDGGEYVCRGRNELGVAQDTIRLRVRSRYAALWPFLGIVVEVVILIAIIFIYEKRRKPGEITDDDDSGAAPLKNDSASNHKDKNVRQRNSN